jgi:hypothetical protein
MAVNDKFSILVPLAKELGYKNAKEMRDALGKEEAGRGGKKDLGFGNIGGAGGVGTGFLGGREIGGGFGVGVKSRLAKGASVKEAISGGFKDFAQTFTAGNIKRRALEKTFGGPGFISAFARGKLKKTYGEESKSPTKEGVSEKQVSSKGSDAYLGILAKSSLAIPGMARDMNVMRQNIQRLVKLKAGPQEKGKRAYATAADFTKREKSEMSGKALSDAERERKKDIDYFAEQDKIEAEQEAARRKGTNSLAPTPEREQNSDGLLEQIFGIIKNGIIAALAYIFTPKNLLKVIGKIFVIGTIIASLFSGITEAWKKWKESGSLYEALVAGIGGIVDFLTFGLFGEEEVKKLFDGISSFFEPLIEGVKGIYYTVKDWVVNNVGIPKIKFTVLGKDIEFGPYYPFKKNPRSEEPETTQAAPKAKEDTGDTTKIRDLGKSEAGTPSVTESTAPSRTGPGEGTAPSPEKVNVGLINLADKYYVAAMEAVDKGKFEDAVANMSKVQEVVTMMDPTTAKAYAQAKGAEIEKALGISPSVEKTSAPSGTGGSLGGMTAGGATGGGAGSVSASESSGGGGGSPSSDVSAPASSGSDLASSSAQVAEAQRMESAADMGTSINTSTTNNNSGTSGQTPSRIADVYDSEFAKLYSMA